MLEQLRQQSRSFIIWILFGIIILVFIISFGPQADQTLGCGASDSLVLSVDGHDLEGSDWRYAINGVPRMLPDLTRGRDRQARANIAMDLLLSRELLAQAGEDAGFRVSTDLVNQKLKKGEWFFLGYPAPKDYFFVDGYFSYNALERHAQNLGLSSVNEFISQQRRELLADAMKSLIVGGVEVSRSEVITSYTNEQTTATIEYVRFRSQAYRRINISDEQIEAYLGKHADDVKKKYEAEAANYKETKPSVKLRQIFIARTAPADPGKSDSADKQSADEAKQKAEAIHAKLAAGGDFAALARENSEHSASAERGGLLGWRRLDRPGLPDKKLTDAIATLAAGSYTPVIDTARGYYILKADDKREGNLSFDQVKRELAEGMAVQQFATDAARADAEAALVLVEQGKSLEDLFNRAPPRFDPNRLRQQLPPGTDVEKLLEQLKKAQPKPQNPKTGAIIVTGEAIPAEWKRRQDPATTPAAAATPAAATPAAATPAAATPAAATPAAATPAAAAAEKKPVSRKIKLKPTKKRRGADKTNKSEKNTDAKPPGEKFSSPVDGLPRPKGLVLPTIEIAGPFNREPTRLERLGESPEAVRAIFDQLENGQTAKQVFEISGDFFIINLVSRREADLAEFTKKEQELRQAARLTKAFDVLGDWLKTTCKKTAERGDISYNPTYLTFQDDKGNDKPITYKPCSFF